MMKKVSTTFLQAVLVLIAMGILAAMIWLPLTEGRNIDSTLFEVYFTDPFLAYAYLSSVPFFTALYQAFTLLSSIERNAVFTPNAVRALRAIKYCGLLTAGLIVGAMAFIVITNDGTDDYAGFVAMGAVTTFASIVVATAAAVFEKMLQVAVDIKSENNLTV